MSTKTNFKNGQANQYTFYPGGAHEHAWYDSNTGKMGYHAEYADAASKQWCGELSRGMNGVSSDSYRSY